MSVSFAILLGFLLFSLGVFGLLSRRNLIVVLLSLELLFVAAGINFVVFSNLHKNLEGQIFTIFLIAVAAGEAAIGIGLLIALFRVRKSANVDEAKSLRG
ncbi:MAG TPA: NADH-quinone oxidoreductase subunit NuoK [Acidobacteriota bacterium]|nr:NADH-quinone oxidoreductase subunit NuoK [Acidobacteriota bacterium]HNT16331.1 NADH-quinone oxidoreductase subunit NuoK [Acidobacteriota bacterium]HPA27952.1 NADH-quinone oxidoreductase subunit NuoK [Acidobacteriota bacterium]HQO19844.1 NADH-quinone oxidoreductase subunit NuoK [Acidobacteriota bacterium]HQQ47184.1 NADH-quinone oxidoreductase subunit NuoK [Acidobacteriota bacterium]